MHVASLLQKADYVFINKHKKVQWRGRNLRIAEFELL